LLRTKKKPSPAGSESAKKTSQQLVSLIRSIPLSFLLPIPLSVAGYAARPRITVIPLHIPKLLAHLPIPGKIGGQPYRRLPELHMPFPFSFRQFCSPSVVVIMLPYSL
jgi:hypothetical protein